MNRVVVYSENVRWIAESLFTQSFLERYGILLNSSKKEKDIRTLTYILDKLVEMRVRKDDALVVIGGGDTLDLVGFASSIWMRGIKLHVIPTTVLAMCDASWGSKNAINYKSYKNLLGTYHAPQSVYINVEFLRSLNGKDYISGFAELIKIALVDESNFFLNLLLNAREKIVKRDYWAIEELLMLSISVKKKFLKAGLSDGKYDTMRHLLNYGHTFGHAIEGLTDSRHGECVAVGMVYAALLSNRLGMLSSYDLEFHISTIRSFGLPVTLSDLSIDSIEYKAIVDAIGLDKKNMNFILLDKIHHPKVKAIDSDMQIPMLDAFKKLLSLSKRKSNIVV